MTRAFESNNSSSFSANPEILALSGEVLVPITYIQIVITDFDKNITVFLGQSTIGPRCERENILAVDIRGLGHNN